MRGVLSGERMKMDVDGGAGQGRKEKVILKSEILYLVELG